MEKLVKISKTLLITFLIGLHCNALAEEQSPIEYEKSIGGAPILYGSSNGTALGLLIDMEAFGTPSWKPLVRLSYASLTNKETEDRKLLANRENIVQLSFGVSITYNHKLILGFYQEQFILQKNMKNTTQMKAKVLPETQIL